MIPALDEEATIGALVEGLRAVGLDVLVVDDGSRDATAERAARAGAEVLRLPENRVKGAALRAGLARALREGYDAALALDADLQHDPREAPRFLAAHARTGADVLIGRRRGAGMPLVRRATNALLSLALTLASGKRLRDTQCGYRLLARRALERLSGLTSEQFEIESEIVLRAAAAKLSIREVPISTIYRPGRTSRIRPLRDTWRFLRLLARALAGGYERDAGDKVRPFP